MPEGGYISKTAAGILVLLTVMITMNGLAIYLRNKFQTKW
jgi:phosphate transport system permease protein